MRLDITPLPKNSVAVRHFPAGSESFDWSVVATVCGDVIELRLFNPGPAHVVPSLGEWRALARQYFPEAKRVRFERRNRGVSRWVEATI